MNKLDDYMKFHEVALSIRGQRQQLIASNIANSDTPNYKAKDIDFGAAFAQAISKTTSTAVAANQVVQTHPRHMQGTTSTGPYQALYRKEVQGNIDGNTVDMDVERNAFTENALRYEASLTMLNMQIKGLLSAIQGQ
jgi:flagellar basal-body rod protein FlgB